MGYIHVHVDVSQHAYNGLYTVHVIISPLHFMHNFVIIELSVYYYRIPVGDIVVGGAPPPPFRVPTTHSPPPPPPPPLSLPSREATLPSQPRGTPPFERLTPAMDPYVPPRLSSRERLHVPPPLPPKSPEPTPTPAPVPHPRPDVSPCHRHGNETHLGIENVGMRPIFGIGNEMWE